MIAIDDLLGLPYGSPYDCATLAREVLERDGFTRLVDFTGLGPFDMERVLGELGFVEVSDAIRDGDILVFGVPARWRERDVEPHLGVVVDFPRFVHAMKSTGVELHSLEQTFWRRTLGAVYRRAG